MTRLEFTTLKTQLANRLRIESANLERALTLEQAIEIGKKIEIISKCFTTFNKKED